MKAPSFQFYPADWRKDPAVQSLSYHDRGIWFEIICLMHESEQRGKLLLNGKSMPNEALSRLLGLDKQILTKTLTTLLDFGVATQCPESGALMNKRMVRDEEIRKVRKNCGSLGGNPQLKKVLVNQKSTTMVNQIPTPSSSSSSSFKEEIEKEANRPKSEAEVLAYSKSPSCPMPPDYAKWFWDTLESSGWRLATGNPCDNWQAAFRSMARSWRAKPYKDSNFQKPKSPEVRMKTQAEYEAEDEEIRRQSREKFKLETANATC